MKFRGICFSIILMASLCFSNFSNGSTCIAEVNPQNNGACDLDYQWDGQNWVMSGAYCIIFRRNAYGAYDCIVMSEEEPVIEA